jgi:hypothetical protein
MRRLLVAVLLLLFAVETADARKRRHRHQQYFVVVPHDARGAFDPRWDAGRRDPRRPRSDRRAAVTLADIVPAGWQLQPPDPNWNGKRFVSPGGAAWFAIYQTAADANAISEHMKTIAFADNEIITYLRGERTWLAVSGFKESRIFYRKAILACAGKAWHHIAFEYPAEQKANMDRFVILAEQALDTSRTECDETVATGRPRQ